MRKTTNAAGFSSPAASEKPNNYQDYTINSDKSKGEIHRRPVLLHRHPDDLPSTLKHLNQWCLSGYDKLPLTAAGYKMDVTDPTNYLSFDEAVAASAKLTCAAGVGFVLTGTNIVVVDVDHCIAESGELGDVAMELLELIPTYAELSQSKTGLHLIYLDNDIPADFSGRKGVVEIYADKRYIALTGWKTPDSTPDLTVLNGMTKRLLNTYFPNTGYNSSADFQTVLEQHSYPPVQSDDQVLQSLQPNQKFQRLYSGDISGYPSQSEADGALMLILATATALNATQMRRLFSQSALGKRDKWVNRVWYQDYLITGAINYAAQINNSVVAAFTLVSITDSTQLSDKLFEAAAICKADPDFYNYYDAFRKYCKQNKQSLNITMGEFANRLKMAEDKLAAAQINKHNQTVERMEQLTLPAPYDKIRWVIPDGYKVNANGIWGMTKDGYKKICSSAIFITQEIVQHVTQDIKNQLYVYTVGKGWTHFDWVDTKILNNASLMSLELSSKIPTINSVNCNQLVSYLTAFRVVNYSNITHLISTDKLGWNDNEFVTPYNSHRYVLETSASNFSQSLQLQGDFDSWKRVAQPVWNHSSVARFILSMGFASVLLKPLNQRNFCLYLWAQSTFGKTTMFSLVSSIWGTTDVMVNLGGTLNGFEGGAAERTDFVYIIDEKQQIRDNFDATKLIMKLANGKGDARATKDGTLKPIKTWRTIGLLNGEEPLLDDWSTNGAYTRSITLHLTDKILPDELTAAIWEDVVNQHCGWAGKIFVDALQSVDVQQLKQHKLECYQQLKQHFPNHHDDHLRYVALGMVTEQLVNQFIFQQPDDSAGTAVDILNQLEVKSALSNAEKEWEHLISWVTKENRHFKNNPTYDTSDICYGEYKKDCLVIIKSVLAEEFDHWSHGRLKIDKILDDLYSAGYILGCHKNGRQTPLKTWYLRINGTKNIPAIKVDLKLITDEPIHDD